jgi:hypothetical protein
MMDSVYKNYFRKIDVLLSIYSESSRVGVPVKKNLGIFGIMTRNIGNFHVTMQILLILI